ncbi:hypothetical protein PIB30_065300 [Stylosanthes scabra]|uniref:Reverse transcriptase domain-containing protein n=1 Tax=Stylosanthes scabra TaxID=79078 RepID=A0ABU6TNJ0_9FABA|nr:hypothetical protein [Stylosanthes scabra]
MAAHNEHDQGVGNQPPPSPQSQPNPDQQQQHNVPTPTPNPGIATRQHSVHDTEVTPGHEYNNSQQNRNPQGWAREGPRNDEDGRLKGRRLFDGPNHDKDRRIRKMERKMRRLKKRLGKRTRVESSSSKEADSIGPLVQKRERRDPVIIGKTHFSPDVVKVRLPRDFDKPTDMKYDGTSDPQEHINAFEARMNLEGVSDAIRCKAFSVSLSGPAMRVGESIRDYLDRFNKVLLEVNRSSATPEVVSLCLIAGLLEGDFRTHLTSKEIT